MTASRAAGLDRALAVAVISIPALAALAVGYRVAHPLGPVAIAFDAQAAVLHFERIASGTHLETFIPTTPKPLLTAVFGPLFAVTADWRSLTIATLAAEAVAVLLAAALAVRLAGPLAGLMAGIAMAVAPSLLFDVGYSLATPWAALGWGAAGLLVTARRPHYAAAGLALALATLARLETAVLSATIAATLALCWVGARALDRPSLRPPARAWLVPIVAFGAFAIMLLHDWRLTGDPLFWTTVSRRYTETTTNPTLTAGEVASTLLHRYLGQPVMTASALLGVAALLVRRRWAILVGLLGLGPGVAIFLVLLAATHVFVSDRYFAAVDVSIACASGVGVAAVLAWIGARVVPTGIDLPVPSGPRQAATLLGLAAATGVIALAITIPAVRVQPWLPSTLATARRLSADAALAVPVLEPVVAGLRSGTGDGAAGPHILVPRPIWPRMMIELHATASDVESADSSRVDLAAGYPGIGQTVFHSLAGDLPSPGWAPLQVSTPTVVDGVLVEPLVGDPGRGMWIVQLRAT